MQSMKTYNYLFVKVSYKFVKFNEPLRLLSVVMNSNVHIQCVTTHLHWEIHILNIATLNQWVLALQQTA